MGSEAAPAVRRLRQSTGGATGQPAGELLAGCGSTGGRRVWYRGAVRSSVRPVARDAGSEPLHVRSQGTGVCSGGAVAARSAGQGAGEREAARPPGRGNKLLEPPDAPAGWQPAAQRCATWHAALPEPQTQQ